ncbi:helicase-related protein [Lysinibacillus sp. BW-2-10]|uniref:helicase-related protein n=1 Tax=Lysinibacillus sp. BW-2-10 TaxID=2590030 RepID=UPI00117F945A|nr:helicase-related protein [Lysinibacillus sp. BW-2-10]TSI05287.1 hypothetical protein FJQ64_13350 [Lysinibacillus sp. BW-2-10]
MYQRKWLEIVDPKKVDLYPIQFANCDRLEANDAVFIFDEVGSGKTISSGLMALDYLEKNPEKKVLVITTNALTKGDNGGQFLNDWFSKLPFKEMGFENNVHLINNHFKNIEKNIGNYGLIIIDEAHLFIEEKTKRFEQLIKMNAHKVVLLTATPIKNSEQDLKVYITIADEILEKNNGTSFETLKDTVSTIGKKPEQLICSAFNKQLPVTRYFKDTIQALNIDDFKKENSKRYHTLIEKYDVNYRNYKEWDELRVKALVRFINSRLEDYPCSRFVIFTRYVQKEAQYIADYLERYEGYKSFGVETKKTYAKVTGENGWELGKYSGKGKGENLPQILIVSYQLAEQGVNLPGFNHIINYHVPAYPAALEQRYGRIDRLTKDGYEQIFNCFILKSGYYGANEENFRKAVSISLHNLLKHLPSRNVILSKETLLNYLDISKHRKKMHEKLRQAVENIEAVKTAFNFYIEQEKQHVNLENIENVGNDKTLSNNSFELLKQETILEEANQDAKLLIGLLEGEERFEINSEQEDLTHSNYILELSLFKEFLSQLIELEVKDSKSEEKRRKLAEYLLKKEESIWDGIFYKKKNEDDSSESLGTINAISGCAMFIEKSEEFNIYKEEFLNVLTNTYIFNKFKHPLNEYFERMFLENKFNHLFPYIVDETYQQQLEKVMKEDSELKQQFIEENCNKDERDVILNEVDSWVEKLPVFIYFKEISLNLCKRSMTDDHPVTGSRIKYFDGNHFVKAIKYINEHVFELGDAIREEINRFTADDLKIELVSNTDKTFEASKWLKIIYHCSRKEIYAKVEFKENVLIKKDFPFFKNREIIKREMLLIETKYPKILTIKEQWNEIAANTTSTDATGLKKVIVNEQIDGYYKELVRHTNNYDKEFEKIRCYRSLFSHILFTDSGYTRTWVDYPFTRNLKIPEEGLVYVNDYWTKGILYELQSWQMSESNDVYSQYKISKCWTETIK